MKTQLFISSVLLSTALFAGNLLYAGTDSIPNPFEFEVSSEYIETENNLNEESIQFESWMADDNYWTIESNDFIPETESGISIENWMTDDSMFGISSNIKQKGEEESAMGIESWMTDNNLWRL